MKTILIFCLFVLATQFSSRSQSIERDVVASSGDYFENANGSLSWTLGEIATETYTNGNIILTEGFQQPFGIVIHGIDLDVLVYLEGPFANGSMNTGLNAQGQIPLSQPYNVAPWFYAGPETVVSIPPNTVDWVLVDLRDAVDASSALPGTSVEMQAAFLLNDGSVVGLDGSSVLQFTASISNDPYVVVWHRNHLGVLSANPPVDVAGIYTYDFSTSVDQAYGGSLGYKLIDTGVYGMAGGDANGDGLIDAADKAIWSAQSGTYGYKTADMNLDAQVNNPDKDDSWAKNGTLSSQIPQ